MKGKPVRIRSEAQAEIEEAFERYREESRELAGRFLTEIGKSVDLIRLHHDSIQSQPGTHDPASFIHSPTSVIYQEKDDLILVLAVAHAKRRPGYWTKRLKQ